jgi:hypothetical protein
MSYYGYEQAISQGSAFNARTRNFNDAVIQRNKVLTDKYNLEVKNQPGKVSNDKTKEEEDGAFYGVSDGKGVISTGIGLIQQGKELSSAVKDAGGVGSGILKYAGTSAAERVNTIKKTAGRLGEMSVNKAQSALKPTQADADGIVTTEGAIADDAGQTAAKAASEEVESSGLGTGILKAGIKKIAGGAVSEAGATAISEVAGKAAGDLGGFVDIGEGIDNLVKGKSFFAGEDKTEAIGDTLQSVGAVADVVGTVFPPAELIGGALGAIGGIFDAVDSISNDVKKKQNDATKPTPPKLNAVKVSPAFSAMGLVASAPISAKQSITGQ